MPTKLLAETRRLLAAAAALRVAGASWPSVAERLGRSPETCRSWPSYYRHVWPQLYAAAEKEYMEEIASEARCILRNQLREEATKNKCDAAKAILSHADRNRSKNSKPEAESAEEHATSLPDHEAHELDEANNGILGPDTTGGANGASGRALPE